MNFVYKKIEKTANTLRELSVLSKTPIEKCKIKECGYKKGDGIPELDGSWGELCFGELLGGVTSIIGYMPI